MKNSFKIPAIAIAIMSSGLLFSQCSEGSGSGLQDVSSESSQVGDSLQNPDDELIQGILYMREEEKLARDVYLSLNEIFPLRPFQNISKSEQAHMDAMLYLIELYGLEDPVGNNPVGKFENEELQALYDELIETGSKSKEDALRVGALIEEVDILDLQHELEKAVAHDEITRVYTNLCNASENHLRAFVRVLGFNNVEYTPVKLDEEAFSSIINE